MKRSIEELLGTPYWIIDILPEQVPKDSPGQYFTIANYYLAEERLAAIKQKHINVILKLNCYRDISIDEETQRNPAPERVAEEMRKRYLYIMLDDAMILSEPDEEKKRSYIGLLALVTAVMEKGIGILGFDAPERM